MFRNGLMALGAAAVILALAVAAGEAGKAAVRGEAKDGLALRLEAAKTEYQAKEPLQLRLFLDNVGDKPLVVLKRTSHVDVGLQAKDGQGRFIVNLLPPAPPPALRAEDLAKLGPGESLELTRWELLERVNQQIEAGHGNAARFTITAVYRARIEEAGKWSRFWDVRQVDKSAWVGELTSNAIEIELKGAAQP